MRGSKTCLREGSGLFGCDPDIPAYRCAAEHHLTATGCDAAGREGVRVVPRCQWSVKSTAITLEKSGTSVPRAEALAKFFDDEDRGRRSNRDNPVPQS